MDLDENDMDLSDFVDVISHRTYDLANRIDEFSRYTMAFSDCIDEFSRHTKDGTRHSLVRASTTMDLSRRTPA